MFLVAQTCLSSTTKKKHKSEQFQLVHSLLVSVYHCWKMDKHDVSVTA